MVVHPAQIINMRDAATSIVLSPSMGVSSKDDAALQSAILPYLTMQPKYTYSILVQYNTCLMYSTPTNIFNRFVPCEAWGILESSV
jgi:hypothetical protein